MNVNTITRYKKSELMKRWRVIKRKNVFHNKCRKLFTIVRIYFQSTTIPLEQLNYTLD